MAKVLGAIMTIWGALMSLFILFLYLNSSAALPYNPASPDKGLLDVGLSAPAVIAVILLACGLALWTLSTEPESK